MILFSLIVVLIGFLLVSTESGKKPLSIESTAESKPESIQETRFFRVYLDETETDNKTVIPMNEYVPGYEKGFVIVGIMDDNDYERLLNTGFDIEEVSNPLLVYYAPCCRYLKCSLCIFKSYQKT